MPAPQALLAIDALGKDYTATVLDGVTLTLNAGEVLALTGENGAGKSTLAKILCGLTLPTRGHMRLAGQVYAPASRRDAERHGLRMGLQELGLVPTVTGAENLLLGRPAQRAGGPRGAARGLAGARCVAQRRACAVGQDRPAPPGPGHAGGPPGAGPAADAGDCAQPARRHPHPGARRAYGHAHAARDQLSVRADRAVDGARRGHRLRLAPARRTAPRRRPRGRAARWPPGGSAPDGRPERGRTGAAHGGPLGQRPGIPPAPRRRPGGSERRGPGPWQRRS